MLDGSKHTDSVVNFNALGYSTACHAHTIAHKQITIATGDVVQIRITADDIGEGTSDSAHLCRFFDL
jgi:hypothetical protein